jgi:dihydrofolate reductase
MAKLRAHNISMSIDGYMAGPNQSLDNPLGEGGESLHGWVFKTKTWTERTGEDGGAEGLDDRFMARGDEGIGATIMGRNMFGPIRGAWGDEEWKGWWGDNPPYHHPVFVLTHNPHESITMEGGTTFYFVADGIEEALEMAVEAADGKDVRLGGGASTIQQYLKAGLVDDLHVAIVPVLLGAGERLFDNLDGGLDGYKVVEFVSSPAVAHVRLAPIPS